MLDDTLLDDPARLAEADPGGWLRSTAMAGAQVRAMIETAGERELGDRLDLGRPRALVLLVRPGVGYSVTSLLAALLAPTCPCPIVVVESVPNWIGALDVVFAHTDDPGDTELASSLELASRYGATVVVSGPSEGPVAAVTAGKGILLSSRIRVPPELAFHTGLAAGLLTANALGMRLVDMEAMAEHLDAEAERDHLSRDSFANPAKALALRLIERTPLLWGLDSVAVAVARQASYALGAHAGVVADVADYRQAIARPALHRAAIASTGERDIFADPDLSDGGQGLSPRVVLFTVRTGVAADAARHEATRRLQGADLVALVEENETAEAIRAGVLALRCEFAAMYLGLAAGSVGGASRYSTATS